MVSNLRGALKPDPRLSIDIEGQGYVLRAPPGAVDALAFGSRVDEARPLLSSDPVAAAGLLRGALELWRGRAYADLADESPLLSAEVVRLEELRLRALEYRLEADLAVGRAGDLVGELEALVDLHPLREGLYRLLNVGSVSVGSAGGGAASAVTAATVAGCRAGDRTVC